MAPLVHLLRAPRPKEIALLHRLLAGAVEVHCGPRLHDPATFEVLVAGRPEREHLEASPRLKLVVLPFAGIPEATRQLLLEFPELAVHNLHHNADATAEMAVGLLLAAAKRLPQADRALRAGDWTVRTREHEALQLAGETALVVGLGAIGRRVARALGGLGMKVLATRRREDQGAPNAVEVHPPEALAELLPRARAVVVCVPLTDETRGLIGSAELAVIDEQAVLVNVSRGPVVDEDALYAALAEGRLFGAGLDVWWRYPEDEASHASTPPSARPFGQLENVVLSPHRGGHVRQTEQARTEHLAALLSAYARGEEPPNRVDLAAGY